MKKNSALMAMIITVFLVVLLVGVGMYVQISKERPVNFLRSDTSRQSTVQQEYPDQLWSDYVNKKLGFSIKFPKHYAHSFGGCELKEEKERSYRPKSALVPTEIFEDIGNKIVYIASQYYYQLVGERKHDDAFGGEYFTFTDCTKVNQTLSGVSKVDDKSSLYTQGWKIEVKDVKDDAGLDAYIKQRYGVGCSVGERRSTTQDGVFDIEIEGDGKDLGETLCPINYVTILKYFPQKQRAVSFDLGQACTFYTSLDFEDSNPSGESCVDSAMADSFRFL